MCDSLLKKSCDYQVTNIAEQLHYSLNSSIQPTSILKKRSFNELGHNSEPKTKKLKFLIDGVLFSSGKSQTHNLHDNSSNLTFNQNSSSFDDDVFFDANEDNYSSDEIFDNNLITKNDSFQNINSIIIDNNFINTFETNDASIDQEIMINKISENSFKNVQNVQNIVFSENFDANDTFDVETNTNQSNKGNLDETFEIDNIETINNEEVKYSKLDETFEIDNNETINNEEVRDSKLDETFEIDNIETVNSEDDVRDSNLDETFEIDNIETVNSEDDVRDINLDETFEIDNIETVNNEDEIKDSKLDETLEIDNIETINSEDDFRDSKLDETFEIDNIETVNSEDEIKDSKLDEKFEIDNIETINNEEVKDSKLDEKFEIDNIETINNEEVGDSKLDEITKVEIINNEDDVRDSKLDEISKVEIINNEDDVRDSKLDEITKVEIINNEDDVRDSKLDEITKVEIINNEDDVRDSKLDEITTVETINNEDDVRDSKLDEIITVETINNEDSKVKIEDEKYFEIENKEFDDSDEEEYFDIENNEIINDDLKNDENIEINNNEITYENDQNLENKEYYEKNNKIEIILNERMNNKNLNLNSTIEIENNEQNKILSKEILDEKKLVDDIGSSSLPLPSIISSSSSETSDKKEKKMSIDTESTIVIDQKVAEYLIEKPIVKKRRKKHRVKHKSLISQPLENLKNKDEESPYNLVIERRSLTKSTDSLLNEGKDIFTNINKSIDEKEDFRIESMIKNDYDLNKNDSDRIAIDEYMKIDAVYNDFNKELKNEVLNDDNKDILVNKVLPKLLKSSKSSQLSIKNKRKTRRSKKLTEEKVSVNKESSEFDPSDDADFDIKSNKSIQSINKSKIGVNQSKRLIKSEKFLNTDIVNSTPVVKKRGRKRKIFNDNTLDEQVQKTNILVEEQILKTPSKRGRKKKIITKEIENDEKIEFKRVLTRSQSATPKISTSLRNVKIDEELKIKLQDKIKNEKTDGISRRLRERKKETIELTPIKRPLVKSVTPIPKKSKGFIEETLQVKRKRGRPKKE